MVQAVLATISIYYLSLFKIPRKIAHLIEKDETFCEKGAGMKRMNILLGGGGVKIYD